LASRRWAATCAGRCRRRSRAVWPTACVGGKSVLRHRCGVVDNLGFDIGAGVRDHPVQIDGRRVLDGVDLDVEGGGPAGYAAFARALRGRMDAAGDGWLLTAAPQCPYPDGHLGPAPGTALGDAADAFDYVFVQFYNNWCRASSGAPFDDSYAAWRALAGAGGPRVVVGLPATPDAAPAGGYVAPEALAPLLDGVAGDPAFAGVMLWDASFDRHSGAPTYAARAAALLGD